MTVALVFLLQAYAAAPACRSCHPAQFAAQSATGHARTLHRAAQHPLAAQFVTTAPLRRPPRFEFRFAGLRVEALDGESSMELPLEWAFGSGEHGVTFVSRLPADSYLEHSFTYYSDAKAFDITPGHRGLPAGTLLQAAGQVFGRPGITRCFQCHSTGPVEARREIRIAEAGVRCEACHGPGRAHAASPTRGNIRNPRALMPDQVLRLCGTCHRAPSGDAETIDWGNPWMVRHQPPYLERSKCYQLSGTLSCVTCHDPHQRLRRNDPGHYSRQCAACHSAEALPPAAVCRAQPDPDCTACHMPAVAADPHLKFRNHWIGVYRNSATLTPSR